MLKTNSAGRKLYNKLRVSDGAVLARNVLYPNAVDDSPIIGDDGTVKFLAIDEDPVPIPGTDYDPRFFSVVTTEGPVEGWQTAPTPTYRIQRTPTKRSVSEIKDNASNEERVIRASLFPPSDVSADLTIACAFLAQKIDGLTPPPNVQEAFDRILKRAAVFADNQENLKQIHAAIDQGHEPDLTAGFTTELPA